MAGSVSSIPVHGPCWAQFTMAMAWWLRLLKNWTSLTADPGPLLALGYPDRIAQSRGGARYRLRHGSGATLPEHDPLTGAGWLVAAEIEGADRACRSDGRIRLAAVLDREDVESIGGEGIATVVRVAWDDGVDDLRATTERVL